MRHTPLASQADGGWGNAVAREYRGLLRATSASRPPRYGSSDKRRLTSPVRWKWSSHAILLASRAIRTPPSSTEPRLASVVPLYGRAVYAFDMSRQAVGGKISDKYRRRGVADAGGCWALAPMWRCDPPNGGGLPRDEANGRASLVTVRIGADAPSAQAAASSISSAAIAYNNTLPMTDASIGPTRTGALRRRPYLTEESFFDPPPTVRIGSTRVPRRRSRLSRTSPYSSSSIRARSERLLHADREPVGLPRD
jgi:hypothetical protein